MERQFYRKPSSGEYSSIRYLVVYWHWRSLVGYGSCTCVDYYIPDSKVHGPTWGLPGSCRPQMGPMLAPRALLSVYFIFMSLIVLYFLHSTSVLSFYIDVVLTPSMGTCLTGAFVSINLMYYVILVCINHRNVACISLTDFIHHYQ